MVTIIFGLVVGCAFVGLGIVILLIVVLTFPLSDNAADNKDVKCKDVKCRLFADDGAAESHKAKSTREEGDKITAELFTAKRKWPPTSH
jgi:hypothetical protein